MNRPASQPDARATRLPGLIAACALVIAFFMIDMAVLAGGGIIRGGDTDRYLSGAQHLLAGQPLVEKEVSYPGFIAVVALAQGTGLGLNGLIACQLIVAALAACALFSLGSRLGGDGAGLLAAGLFIADLSIARWNFFILTDSLFISAVVLTVWAAQWAAARGGWRYGPALLLALAAGLIRPNGWLLLPLVAVYWLWIGISHRRWRWIGVGLVVMLAVTAALLVRGFQQGVDAESPGRTLRIGEVVWGFPDWRLAMPSDSIPASGSMTDAFGYGLRHLPATLTLIGARLLANFADVRPYYGDAANALIAGWLLPIYALAVVGVIRFGKRPVVRLALAIMGAQSLIVAATFADWSGRFLAYILPLIYLLAAAGLNWLWQHHRSRRVSVAVVLAMFVLGGIDGARAAGARQTPASVFFRGDLPAGVIARQVDFEGGLRLVGFIPWQADPRPGTYRRLTLFWEAPRAITTDVVVTVQLLSPQGERIAGEDRAPGTGRFPQVGPSWWAAGARVAESTSLLIPENAPPVLDVLAAVYDPDKGRRMAVIGPDGAPTSQNSLRLGRIGLDTPEGVPALVRPVSEADFRLGDSLRLTGFSLPQTVTRLEGITVGARLEATGIIFDDYALFVHVIDPSGKLVAQSDSPVLAGDWTTAALIPGLPLGAQRTIDLPPDLPTGEYRVALGMYAYPSLERLEARDSQGKLLPDSIIPLGTVTVK